MVAEQTEWIAVDWGTSNLRVWVLGQGGQVLASHSSDKGMGQLKPEAFEDALLDLIGNDLPEGRATPVICCGMVGARQGWVEAPYAGVPCAVPGMDRAVRAPSRDPRLEVHILPGVSQRDPADVMRGEETQIGGLLAASPEFDGIVCLPGTHTKWVHVSAREIVSFRTFMTGELFELLSKHSVLRHSVGQEGWDGDAFAGAVADAMGSPQYFSARLFTLRAESLVGDASPARTRARLSGLLVGLELAGARTYWLGQNVVILGNTALCALYRQALSLQGVTPECLDGGQTTLAGLTAAYKGLKENTP